MRARRTDGVDSRRPWSAGALWPSHQGVQHELRTEHRWPALQQWARIAVRWMLGGGPV